MSVYKLHYFGIRALGEPARMLFNAAGVKFEDIRVPREQWPEIKKTAPVGKMPWIEVDGHVIPESFAIYRFLGSKFNFYGKDELERATIDSMADIWRDFANSARDYLLISIGRSDGDKEAAYNQKFVPAGGVALPYFGKVLQNSGSGFIGSSGLSWADCYVAESILTLNGVAPDFFKKYPFSLEFMKRVHEHPKLKSYVESREPSII